MGWKGLYVYYIRGLWHFSIGDTYHFKQHTDQFFRLASILWCQSRGGYIEEGSSTFCSNSLCQHSFACPRRANHQHSLKHIQTTCNQVWHTFSAVQYNQTKSTVLDLGKDPNYPQSAVALYLRAWAVFVSWMHSFTCFSEIKRTAAIHLKDKRDLAWRRFSHLYWILREMLCPNNTTEVFASVPQVNLLLYKETSYIKIKGWLCVMMFVAGQSTMNRVTFLQGKGLSYFRN